MRFLGENPKDNRVNIEDDQENIGNKEVRIDKHDGKYTSRLFKNFLEGNIFESILTLIIYIFVVFGILFGLF